MITKQTQKKYAEQKRKVWRQFGVQFSTGLVILLLIVAALAFRVAFNTSPVAIGQYFIARMGSGIGVSISVPPNPFNTLAQQLQEKEETLLEKDADLVERETLFVKKVETERSKENKTLSYLLIVGGVLLILILLNFYFDHRRKKNLESMI